MYNFNYPHSVRNTRACLKIEPGNLYHFACKGFRVSMLLHVVGNYTDEIHFQHFRFFFQEHDMLYMYRHIFLNLGKCDKIFGI